MTIDYYCQVCLIYMRIKYYYNKIYNPSLILLVPSLAFLFNVTLSLQFIIL